MSQFGFKSNKKPANKQYDSEMDQLQELGFNDKGINLNLLKLCNGDINLVIEIYSKYESTSTNIMIQKEQIISHFIYPTCIHQHDICINLSLHEPVETTTYFYVYQVGNEENEYLCCFKVEKGTKEAHYEIDADDDFAFYQNKIALYQNEHDKEAIPGSNVLQITWPGSEDDYFVYYDYMAPSILSSTIRAIQADDEKDENIYVYFDFPRNLKGEEIHFKIVYDDNDNKEEEFVSLPLVFNKESIGTSFRIITCVEIEGKEYRSDHFDRIQIIHPTSMQSNDVETEIENKAFSEILELESNDEDKEIEGWKNRCNALKSSHDILKDDKNKLQQKIVELNQKMNKLGQETIGLRKEYKNEKEKNILFQREKNRMIQHQNEESRKLEKINKDLRDKLHENDDSERSPTSHLSLFERARKKTLNSSFSCRALNIHIAKTKDDSEQSPTSHLSLFERARKKTLNSPQNNNKHKKENKKRKRNVTMNQREKKLMEREKKMIEREKKWMEREEELNTKETELQIKEQELNERKRKQQKNYFWLKNWEKKLRENQRNN